MASDLDTVRVLRALFHDMPHAPAGLTPEENIAWTQRAMAEFEGGDMAYTLEHVTRSAMLDLILRLREDGYLQEDALFDKMLQQVSTAAGRQTFQDWCINAQKSADATARLLNRASPAWSEPAPLFVADAQQIERFVAGRPSGPGPLFAEFVARDDVREIGVFEARPTEVYEFSWGFVTESTGSWAVYLPEVWRAGSVGGFERFLSAWRLETQTRSNTAAGVSSVPAGIGIEVGIVRFCCLVLQADNPRALRRWVGEVFLGHMLPAMAARVLDPNYEFPDAW